jgi:hypothetical protein
MSARLHGFTFQKTVWPSQSLPREPQISHLKCCCCCLSSALILVSVDLPGLCPLGKDIESISEVATSTALILLPIMTGWSWECDLNYREGVWYSSHFKGGEGFVGWKICSQFWLGIELRTIWLRVSDLFLKPSNPVTIVVPNAANFPSLTCFPLCLINHDAMKSGSGGIAPGIRNLSTRWRWVVNFKPLSLHPRGETVSGIHWIRGWMDSRASMDMMEEGKISCPYLNVLHPVVFYIVSRGTDTQRLWYSQYCSITVSNFITFTTCFGSQNHHQVTPFTKFSCTELQSLTRPCYLYYFP